jgi:assimilatory nitrate reductase catalytic subunit
MQSMTAPQAIRTTCPYCGVGCGVLATVAESGEVRVSGDPQHPANFGRLCSKGAALAETLGSEGRLLHPVVDGAQTSWDTALDRVAEGFGKVIRQHGPDAVAFYVSGQLLTEDYYVANKLMKGFIGSANIDTNSRLCMSTAVAAHKRAFGADAVPVCYEDVEVADLVVIVGSNYAWAHPVLYQRLAAAKKIPPGHAGGGGRSAAHGDLRHRRPASGHRAGKRCLPVQRPAALPAARGCTRSGYVENMWKDSPR